MHIPKLYDIHKFNVTHQFQARENLPDFQKGDKHTLASSDTNENHSIRFSLQEEPIEQNFRSAQQKCSILHFFAKR